MIYLMAQVFEPRECDGCRALISGGSQVRLQVRITKKKMVVSDGMFCLRCIGNRPIGQPIDAKVIS